MGKLVAYPGRNGRAASSAKPRAFRHGAFHADLGLDMAFAFTFVDSFNETDARRRRAAIESLYTEDASYVDPNVDLAGREASTASSRR